MTIGAANDRPDFPDCLSVIGDREEDRADGAHKTPPHDVAR